VFTQISPYQTELVIQPRGTRIPVVDSLQSIPARSFEIRQSLACLVKQENIVLLLANTVESALPYGSNVEHMLMESVRHSWAYCQENLLTLVRSGDLVLALHTRFPGLFRILWAHTKCNRVLWHGVGPGRRLLCIFPGHNQCKHQTA
jgi:hypothetical protein